VFGPPRKRVDVRLVELGVFESRAKARAAIEAGLIKVDGRVVAKPSEMIGENVMIEAEPPHPWVSRGGLKLALALKKWPIHVKGRVVLDVGASTGGFTQVALAHGAARVYAVDVGHGQLHPKLVADPRVVNLERLDARALTAEHVPEPPRLIVSDVSFISLEKALPAALALAQVGADLVALAKPQFELGRERVGKGGIVKDPTGPAEAVALVSDFLKRSGWRIEGKTGSPIRGGDGNREMLIWAKK
jgi:23S rRNA (cytidine1920-2'-O)/16S rRNA (cytidine1409-2'-O)-methyltransferase